jgi:hypothetical protein
VTTADSQSISTSGGDCGTSISRNRRRSLLGDGVSICKDVKMDKSP